MATETITLKPGIQTPILTDFDVDLAKALAESRAEIRPAAGGLLYPLDNLAAATAAVQEWQRRVETLTGSRALACMTPASNIAGIDAGWSTLYIFPAGLTHDQLAAVMDCWTAGPAGGNRCDGLDQAADYFLSLLLTAGYSETAALEMFEAMLRLAVGDLPGQTLDGRHE